MNDLIVERVLCKKTRGATTIYQPWNTCLPTKCRIVGQLLRKSRWEHHRDQVVNEVVSTVIDFLQVVDESKGPPTSYAARMRLNSEGHLTTGGSTG